MGEILVGQYRHCMLRKIDSFKGRKIIRKSDWPHCFVFDFLIRIWPDNNETESNITVLYCKCSEDVSVSERSRTLVVQQ